MEEIRNRKLQPIYHALESGNWRQAVRLCEKRDVEKWLTTKALKANGLWRLGKFDEGLRLCFEVQAANPTDEDTLAAMSFNYRIMNRREHMAPMFETAVKSKPGDASLLKELFMCYVRAKEYLKAQQTATKLYKLNSNRGKYIIWAAATMLLQAQRKDPSAGPTTLPLAEKMALKVLQDQATKGSPPVREELVLYVDILELQGKQREAIDALDRFQSTTPSRLEEKQAGTVEAIDDESNLEGGTVVQMQELDRLEKKVGLYRDLGDPDDLKRAEELVVKDLLRRCPDQWSYYSSFLDLVEKRSGVREPRENGEQGWPAVVLDAIKTIWRLQEENPRLRGPFLAEMELMKRAIAWFTCDSTFPPVGSSHQENGTVAGGPRSEQTIFGERLLWRQLCRCIARYMTMFSAKLCCFGDMRPYLAIFFVGSESPGLREGLSWLREYFRREAVQSKVEEGKPETAEDSPLDPEQRGTGVKRLHRYICACQARHLLGDYTASSEGNPNAGPVAAEGDDNSSSSLQLQQYRDVVRELTAQYRATLHLNLGGEGGQREVQHGDDLIMLGARTVLRLSALYEKNGFEAKAYLARVEAACLLESAISCSPYNHHLKILAMDVYRRLGSFPRGLTLFGELDIKQIQLDTLSYLMMEPSGCHGLFGEVRGQCRGIKTIHRNCRNDTADHVARAFERGNYSKGSEVDRFQTEKMDRSLQLAMASAGKVRMDVILEHQTFLSAARYLQEEALSAERKGTEGTIFPGDAWLDGLTANMDYSVQEDRCRAASDAEVTALEDSRRRQRNCSLKRLLLANETLMLALKDVPPLVVDSKATELEAAVAELSSPINEEDLASSLSTLAIGDGGASGRDGGEGFPWKMLAAAARALAFARRHAATAAAAAGAVGSGSVEEGDPEALERATQAMAEGAECAKAYRKMLWAWPRHVCQLEIGEGRGKVSQTEAPLQPQWLHLVSKALADGVVYTCILLQAIGAELPADKKKKGKGSKGKGKGNKGKKPSSALSTTRIQEALSTFGWEVTEILRTMSTPLKSEISAKMEPARPGETLSRLVKGELGPGHDPVIGALWEKRENTGGAQWCKEDVISEALVGVTGGQALCCQRLLSVVTENLSLLQRWEKK